MKDDRSRPVHEPTGIPSEISQKRSQLHWARECLAQIPNFPDGKLKDSFTSDVRSILNQEPLANAMLELKEQLTLCEAKLTESRKELTQLKERNYAQRSMESDDLHPRGRKPTGWRNAFICLLVLVIFFFVTWYRSGR